MKNNGSDQKFTPLLRVFAFIAVLIFLFIRQNAGNEDMKTPILILIAGIFIGGFIALIWHGVKEWKKTDEEIVANYVPMTAFFRGTDARTPQQKVTNFFGAVAVVAFFLYNTREHPGALSRYIICGIILLIFGLPFLRPWLESIRGTEDSKPVRIQPEVIASIIIGLIPCGFMCFFIGTGIYHGVWWFVLPPGSIFLFIFSRPLVAGVRTILLHRKDNGERHVRKGREIDPWDRPDIER